VRDGVEVLAPVLDHALSQLRAGTTERAGWPARLAHGTSRSGRCGRATPAAWTEVRIRNERWLTPWEGRNPNLPPGLLADRHSTAVFAAMLRTQRREARAGRVLPMAVVVDGALAGR
jgi:ribosomal-protein-alanine N-acetyltransferase